MVMLRVKRKKQHLVCWLFLVFRFWRRGGTPHGFMLHVRRFPLLYCVSMVFRNVIYIAKGVDYLAWETNESKSLVAASFDNVCLWRNGWILGGTIITEEICSELYTLFRGLNLNLIQWLMAISSTLFSKNAHRFSNNCGVLISSYLLLFSFLVEHCTTFLFTFSYILRFLPNI